MNRKLLALAVTAAFSLPMAAHAAPAVYGQLNLSVDMIDSDLFDKEVQVNSNSSRFGVKGEEALGTSGLSAVYKAEWGVSGDGDAADLNMRDRYLGVKSSWGTLKAGVFDSPLKASQGNVDQFNDMTYADMANFVTGDNRLRNLVGYESPRIADSIVINVALQSGEDDGTGMDDSGASVSVVYDASGLYLALAADKNVADSTFSNVVESLIGAPIPLTDLQLARDSIRLTGGFTADSLQLGALLQTSELSSDALGDDLKETSFLLSAAFTVGSNVFKGQYVQASYDLGGDDLNRKGLFVGADHNFSQMTKAYAQLGFAKTEAGGFSVDDKLFTVGMLTKF